MERFVRLNHPTASNSKLENITAAERAKQYKELHEDDGKLFCTPCNNVVDQRRNSTIRDHLSSANHLKRKSETLADIALKRQTTITSRMARHTIAFTATNTPLFLLNRVVNGGAIPSHKQLQERYTTCFFFLLSYLQVCNLKLLYHFGRLISPPRDNKGIYLCNSM
uniref:U1-type domain-containing protein n=1 Tax=Sparus aurata TaxID=8175 RepID=A0A671VGL7_SPAAU